MQHALPCPALDMVELNELLLLLLCFGCSAASRYGAASSGFRASTVAQHKHSNDLLVSDPDKSDYDW